MTSARHVQPIMYHIVYRTTTQTRTWYILRVYEPHNDRIRYALELHGGHGTDPRVLATGDDIVIEHSPWPISRPDRDKVLLVVFGAIERRIMHADPAQFAAFMAAVKSTETGEGIV